MSDHDNAHDIQHHVKRYLFVFYALIVGTVITVAASRLPISSVALTVAIALFIACIKGFLVAGYFMHLISEKKMIYGILVADRFLFRRPDVSYNVVDEHNSMIHSDDCIQLNVAESVPSGFYRRVHPAGGWASAVWSLMNYLSPERPRAGTCCRHRFRRGGAGPDLLRTIFFEKT